ncbi:MAG: sugar phosphate isomerase/epimerase [Kiritimatiellae bacterium]|nr:sugar phosphate isomerase/epimerase [Kiritimatiellia bacterium]
MEFALSTHWNAARHASGENLVEEILALGFRRLELGYDLRRELVPGIQAMIKSGAVKVDSLHNFCPVPMGAVRGHPEIWTMAARDEAERESAIRHTANTLRFAAEVGARFVVVHAGNVEMPMISTQLFDLCIAHQQFSPAYERLRMKLQEQRDKKAPRQFDHLLRSLERIIPTLEETGVTLALENLPTWEAFPTEIEFEQIKRRFPTPLIRYWHDLGHGQIRQNIGFINHERWLERLQPHLVGMHVHDVHPPATDHVMPPRGQIDFTRFKSIGASDIVRVIEPSSRTPAEQVAEALVFLKETWGTPGRIG